MERFTLLFVDDEEDVIRAIIKKIDWDSIGFEVLGLAGNGRKGLEMIEELQPDVVMSDIRMPYMDGIEMTKEIRKNWPDMKILFFTGFDEFEFAREAVHLEVEEYILKPIRAVELTEIFQRLHAKMTQEYREKRDVEAMIQNFQSYLPQLQANFYSDLIEGKIPQEDLKQQMKDYHISLTGPCYSCIVIHTSSHHVLEGLSYMLVSSYTQKLARERLQERFHAVPVLYKGNLVLIVQLKRPGEMAELTEECNRFCRYVKKTIDAVATIGIGKVTRDLMELPGIYSAARQALSYRAIYGVERAINIQDVEPMREQADPVENSSHDLENLFSKIRLNRTEEMEEAAELYLEHTFTLGRGLQRHRIAMMELISSLYFFVQNSGIDTEEMLGEADQLYTELLGMDRAALKSWLAEQSRRLAEQMTSSRSNTARTYIAGAQEYIREHYGDEELSLDTVCSHLGVSNAYFSTLFKKETGESFIAYLTRFRMETAARLLVETGEKNYIIAGQVGYSDPNYFSYVFKRQFGVSPSRYIREHEKKNEQ
ncbi:MAG: response regulator [Lachnospiraceae bacterium]|nr:response regulator [Lachnospiraceae bacterium]